MPGNSLAFHDAYLGCNGDQPPTGRPSELKFNLFAFANSAFAKIPLPSTPISQFYDRDAISYKYWNPPAERISKLKVRFRFHNGQLVQFGQFNFTFMLEFNMLRPQQERSYSIREASSLAQLQSHGGRFT